jgi:uncharacterized membrane protein YgdD (TMEM256/DUF423 family)
VRANAWIAAGASSAALAVALGAFGAHALKTRVDEPALELWRTAVLYQALHALALIAFGLFRARGGTRDVAGWAFLAGSIVFAGTLDALALGGPKWLGAITPIGGLLFIAGWIDFAVQAFRARS